MISMLLLRSMLMKRESIDDLIEWDKLGIIPDYPAPLVCHDDKEGSSCSIAG